MDKSEAGKLGWEKTQHIHTELAQERTRKCIEDYEANPKFCLNCGEKIPFEKRRGKFCNKSCSATYNNRGVTRHVKHSKICPLCGGTKKTNNKYCKDCADKRMYNRVFSTEQASCDRIRRKILIERRGHHCQKCGLTEWFDEPVPLELHHIDGNTDNNVETNLLLLCRNCHGITDDFKGSGMGKNGSRQQMRRKRYSEGKTW